MSLRPAHDSAGIAREIAMTEQNPNPQNAKPDGGNQSGSPGQGAAAGNKQKAADQGGHAGMAGHGGQHSGGMGGEHGGDLHDIGTGQSGMTGGAGMGGNESTSGQPGGLSDEPADIPGGEELAGEVGLDDVAEIQQSAQREGMGQHRHRGRGHDQAEDATADVDKLGSQQSGAAKSGDGGPRR
jgi:hypothetical protein